VEEFVHQEVVVWPLADDSKIVHVRGRIRVQQVLRHPCALIRRAGSLSKATQPLRLVLELGVESAIRIEGEVNDPVQRP
jgi:hypothetical protein